MFASKRLSDWFTKDKLPQVHTVIGNRGYGKSYAVSKMMELIEERGWPFLCVDRMGVHYTLREKYDQIVLIGGDHADFSLDDGMLVLKSLLDSGINVILDISQLEDLAAQEVVQMVFEYLYNHWHKESKRVVHYVLEEADMFLGQTGANKNTKSTLLRCITKGRMYGMGFTLVTQRFRLLDKTALTQSNTYIVFNIKYPLDLTLLRQLIGEDKSYVIRQLRTGVCMVISDEGTEILKVNKKHTSSGGSTPQFGEVLPEAVLMPLREKLKESIAATLEE